MAPLNGSCSPNIPNMSIPIKMCDIFSCDMDTLLRRDAEEEAAGKEIKDNKEHREQMQSFRTKVGFIVWLHLCKIYKFCVAFKDFYVSFW